jgi:Rhamnan synthesis protein F
MSALGELRIESGRWTEVLASDRVAVLAHWSDSARVSRSVRALAADLSAAGFATVLVSTAEVPGPLDLEGAPVRLVARRPNIAYDFGSWAHVLTGRPELGRDRHVLLVNDSLAGPFQPGRLPLDRFVASAADVWGLIASRQFGWHLQSYCVGYAPGVLAEPLLRRFWAGVRPQRDKTRVIGRYELGLSRMLRSEAFRLEAWLPDGVVCAPELNPMIRGWRGVLDHGLPVVKRELLRDPGVAPDGRLVPGELARRYDIDVRDWI